MSLHPEVISKLRKFLHLGNGKAETRVINLPISGITNVVSIDVDISNYENILNLNPFLNINVVEDLYRFLQTKSVHDSSFEEIFNHLKRTGQIPENTFLAISKNDTPYFFREIKKDCYRLCGFITSLDNQEYIILINRTSMFPENITTKNLTEIVSRNINFITINPSALREINSDRLSINNAFIKGIEMVIDVTNISPEELEDINGIFERVNKCPANLEKISNLEQDIRYKALTTYFFNQKGFENIGYIYFATDDIDELFLYKRLKSGSNMVVGRVSHGNGLPVIYIYLNLMSLWSENNDYL